MKPFQFRFKRVEDWKETVRNEKRSLLAEAVRLESDLLDQISETKDEIEYCLSEYRKRCTAGEVDVDSVLNWRRHEHQHRVNLQKLHQQLELVQREMERRREILREADQEVKVFQKLHERDFEEYQVTEKRREQNQLDEFSQKKNIKFVR